MVKTYTAHRALHLILFAIWGTMACTSRQNKNDQPQLVSEQTMNAIYETVKTPYKQGVILTPPDSTKMVDSPTIFRNDSTWYMTYIIFDGKGYETWMAESADLMHWDTTGRILSFTDSTWDASQKEGYVSLSDIKCGGKREVGCAGVGECNTCGCGV